MLQNTYLISVYRVVNVPSLYHQLVSQNSFVCRILVPAILCYMIVIKVLTESFLDIWKRTGKGAERWKMAEMMVVRFPVQLFIESCVCMCVRACSVSERATSSTLIIHVSATDQPRVVNTTSTTHNQYRAYWWKDVARPHTHTHTRTHTHAHTHTHKHTGCHSKNM